MQTQNKHWKCTPFPKKSLKTQEKHIHIVKQQEFMPIAKVAISFTTWNFIP